MKPINELTATDIKNIRFLFLDFDGVLTNNKVYVTETGSESVSCSRLDGIGLNTLQKVGIIPHVISTEKNQVVQQRCQKLGVAAHNNVTNKPAIMEEILRQYNLTFNNAAFVGNDINDLPALRAAAISMCVQDRFPTIDSAVQFVTERKGGDGAVREICDKIVSLYESKNG